MTEIEGSRRTKYVFVKRTLAEIFIANIQPFATVAKTKPPVNIAKPYQPHHIPMLKFCEQL